MTNEELAVRAKKCIEEKQKGIDHLSALLKQEHMGTATNSLCVFCNKCKEKSMIIATAWSKSGCFFHTQNRRKELWQKKLRPSSRTAPKVRGLA